MNDRKTAFSTHSKDIPEAHASSRGSLPLSVSHQQQRWLEFTQADERAKRIFGPGKSGYRFAGRDDMGLPVENPGFKALKMVLEPSCPRVTVFFRKEDKKQINGCWKEVEQEMKHSPLAKKDVESSTHLIRAVRSFKDMRANYRSELLVLEKKIQSIEPQEKGAPGNADPNQRWRNILEGLKTDSGLDRLIESLSDLRSALSEKDLALLHIVAAGRVEETLSAFKGIRALPPEKRAAPLSMATAQLTAVRNRLHSRQLGIAHLMRVAKYREDALRLVRDRWLYSQLSRFSSGINRAREDALSDLRRRDVLTRVLGMADELAHLQKDIERFRKKAGWSDSDETALESKLDEFESIKAACKALPWHDQKERSSVQGSIRRLKKKENPAPEEEARLAGLESTIEGMKWEAKTFDSENSGKLRELGQMIRTLQKKRDEHENNIVLLESAENAFSVKSTEAMRCLWANWALFCMVEKKPEFLPGNYGSIHHHIKEGNIALAREKITGKVQELDDFDPRFILDELSKSPDRYLGTTISELSGAVAYFESALKTDDKKQVFESLRMAQAHFTDSAMTLRDLVFPQNPE